MAGTATITEPPPLVDFCTSLDQTETNPQPGNPCIFNDYDPPDDRFRVQPVLPEEAAFIHSGSMHERRSAWEALKAIAANPSRLDRFANCGSCCYVEYSPSEKAIRLTANRCHDRFCPTCARTRSRVIAGNLARHVQKRTVKFATLTLRHMQLPLQDQVARLYKCFTELRRRKDWKSAVTGGAAFLELKWIPATRQWHPHLHLLIDSKYLPQKTLAENWHAVTGDSYIVDIRAVHNAEEVAGYVAKYASKPMETHVYNDQPALRELMQALRGRHTCLTFGSWRGLDLDHHDPEAPDWRRLGRLTDLIRDARTGDPYALQLLDALKEKVARVEGISTSLLPGPDG